MSWYAIELHEKSTRRGCAKVLESVNGTRRDARKVARGLRKKYRDVGSVVERWLA